jgi:hypothetical protein
MADLRYHRTEKEGHLHWVKRVDLYTNTLDSIFDAGRMLALGDLVIIDWIVDHGAEHCEGCLLLEQHSPYTRDNLPSTPRDGATQCLSNCKCKLKVRKVSPSEYAAVEASQTHKLVILELLKATKTRHLGTRRR